MMKKSSPDNPIQLSILRKLAHSHSLRFSEINEGEYPSDLLSYHIRQLLKNGFVSKDGEGKYLLTEEGSALTLDLDKNLKKYVQRGVIGAIAIITKSVDGTEHILMQKRTRHPDRGRYVFPGGQVLFGESVVDAIQRVVNIETGLDAKYKLISIDHIARKDDNNPLQDLYLFYHVATHVSGEAEESGPNGQNIWIPVEEFEKMSHLKGISEAWFASKSDSPGVVFKELV